MHNLFNLREGLSAHSDPPVPRVELVAYDDRYAIKADVHAAGTDGVAISLEGGVLTITSEEGTELIDGILLPRVNTFRYTMALPDDADENSLAIEYEGRVLTLTFDCLG